MLSCGLGVTTMTITQDLPSLQQRLLPQLAELGSSAHISGIWPLETYYLGAIRFAVQESVAYDLHLSNTGGGVLLAGTVSADVQTECARCLEPAQFTIEGEVEGYYLINPSREELDLADDEFVIVDDSGEVDLAPALLAAIIFETPQVVLCDQECKGLCLSCGANLNEQQCDCQQEVLPDSPFFVLKNLDIS